MVQFNWVCVALRGWTSHKYDFSNCMSTEEGPNYRSGMCVTKVVSFQAVGGHTKRSLLSEMS